MLEMNRSTPISCVRSGSSRSFVTVLVVMLALTAGLVGEAAAQGKEQKARQTVEKSKLTVETFQSDTVFTRNYDGYLKTAKGFMIIPQMVKGAFIFGGSGGSGVLVARDETTGGWSQPAFYTLGGVSFGLQAGGQASETLIIVTNERGLNRLLNSGAKLGADLSMAVGPIGEGVGTADITADLIVFTRNKGLYGGVSVEGSVVDVRQSWNRAYFGEDLRPSDILLHGKGKNPNSDPLLEAVAKLTGSETE
jgi:lipid-binding SYLF domain-containing protein